MNRILASNITEDYFKSWINQDKELFLSVLDESIVVNECTGDTYVGKTVAERWFVGWHSEGNRVLAWNIDNHYYDDMKETASITWTFRCLYQSKVYTFDGVTVMKFKDNRIVCLDEYQMEREKKYPYSD